MIRDILEISPTLFLSFPQRKLLVIDCESADITLRLKAGFGTVKSRLGQFVKMKTRKYEKQLAANDVVNSLVQKCKKKQGVINQRNRTW